VQIHERIEKVLNASIALHNEGTPASEAVAKVASDNDLNPETISRVVEAFNIAKTKAYVKIAKDKTADFDIANKKDVLLKVFGGEDTGVKKEASFVSTGGFSLTFEKKAEEEDISVSRTSEIPLETYIKNAYQVLEDQKVDLEAKRLWLERQKIDFVDAISKAAEILTYQDERDNSSKHASEIFYQYSDKPRAGKILGIILKLAQIDLDDVSHDLVGAREYSETQLTKAFDTAVVADEEYSSKSAKYNKDVAKYQGQEDALKEMIYKGSGARMEKNASELLFGSSANQKEAKDLSVGTDLIVEIFGEKDFSKIGKDEKSEKPSRGSTVGDSVLGILNLGKTISPKGVLESSKILDPSMPDKLDQMAADGHLLRLRGIDSPRADAEAKAETDNINREFILRELLADEIISQQDPHEVANAYNAMTLLAPTASLIPDVARSVLRQGTAQVIDPHFAKTLSELEANLLKNSGQVQSK